ncbi:MAG: hypothetical protein KJZ79_15070 [Bryobacteraceae bacterium]|nr:hypothetical protein [Bryobacteraceae bacterium]
MPQPKLILERRPACVHQRSGWAFALDSLAPLLRSGPPGILLDSMIERTFSRELETSVREQRIPYRRPWVGFVHVPGDIPDGHDASKSLLRLARLPAWQDSLPHCRGIVTLSQHHAAWVRSLFSQLPVLALRHPTESAAPRFQFEEYLRHGQPVVQVGWWLRRLASIHQLPLPKSRKFHLIPHSGADLDRYFRVLAAESAFTGAPPLDQWDAHVLPRQSNDSYDALLARSVVFLHLHGAVANNAIIESIVRHTPVLVNPLPSVREYLGEKYPLYFDTLDEAAAKAANPDLVLAAHHHLAQIDPGFLSGETFCREFAESALYQSLDCP